MARDFQASCSYLIHDCAHTFRHRFSEQIASLRFTQVHWRILALLSRGGPFGQSQIADLLALHKVPVGKALNELESDGWVKRCPMPEDGRALEVALTVKSEPLIVLLRCEFDTLEAQLMSKLEDRAALNLHVAMRTIRDELRDSALDQLKVKDESPLWLLLDCERRLMRRLDARLAELGFTRSQWLVMNALHHNEGQTQIELAIQLDMSATLVCKLLDQLAQASWVERRDDPSDRRVKRLDITPDKRTEIARIRRLFDQSHNTLLDVLGADAKEDLTRSLTSIRDALKEEYV